MAEHLDRSFVQNTTEDEDNTKMIATPEPTEQRRGKGGRGRASQAHDSQGASSIGKIRHLKKEDGEPLWRKDIQFDLLKAIFDNEQKVFTNSWEPDQIGKQTFADLYIDTMSRSSKTSKVLRDKLLSDRAAAKSMAMVCLLVNIGRMNTTLNCTSSSLSPSTTWHSHVEKPADVFILQSFPRCGLNYEPTTRSHRCKPPKIAAPTRHCRMRRG